MQHRTETRVELDGTIVLRGLPFHEGDKVTVVISTQPANSPEPATYSLRGLPVKYENPFEPVAENDWGALS